MPVLFTNNASTTLSAGINNSTTTIPIASAGGFPSLSSGKYYFGTISNTNNTKIEIVKVTSGTTSLTVTRGQDGTSAQAFDSGDNFQLRVTAATLSATSVTDVAITGGSVTAETIIAKSDGSTDGYIQLNCAANTHGIKLKSPPHSAGASYTLTFPNDDGNANQKLTTNGSGVLTWTADTDTVYTHPNHSGDVTSSADGAQTIAADAVTGAKIADNAINSEHYTDGSIDHVHLAADCIDGDNIQDDVINSEHIAADSIDAEHLAPNSVNTDAIVDASVRTAHIQNGDITADKLASNSVDSDELVDGSVDLSHMSANSVDSPQYVDGSIDTAHYAAGSVNLAAMKANSIDSDQYVDGSIDTAHIGDAQVSLAKMSTNSVSTNQYVDGSIQTAHITNANITLAKMAANSVDSSQYVDGSIDTAHIGNDQVTADKLSNSLGNLSGHGISHVGLNSGDFIKWTDNTKQEFAVNGNIEMQLEADGDLHVDGDVIAFSTTISDATLKYDINPIEHALDKVAQLTGVTYKYLKDGMESAGLLAQDVEKVMPCAVTERELPLHKNDGKSYKTLNYDNLHALLIESIKELTAKVEKLEKK